MTELEFTAYHEAGHAVADWRFDHLPTTATIKPDPSRGIVGAVSALEANLYVFGADGVDTYNAEGVRNLVIAFYAGAAAQLHAGDTEENARVGGADDTEKAAWWISRLEGDPVELERTLRAAASRFVVEHWAAVERVAEDLLRFETIDDAEIEALCLGELDDLWRYREQFGGHLPGRPRTESMEAQR